MTSQRVKGHILEREGLPFTLEWDDFRSKLVWQRAQGGDGSGRCSCGEVSETLPSTAARQRWFRAHKDAVLKARGE